MLRLQPRNKKEWHHAIKAGLSTSLTRAELIKDGKLANLLAVDDKSNIVRGEIKVDNR